MTHGVLADIGPSGGASGVLETPNAGEPAHHLDPLTGLPDRRWLHRALANCGAVPVALLLVDLDRFKAVNDTLGHPVGDQLLCKVVERMRSVIRASDLIVRLGGDEFGILQHTDATVEGARAIATRLVDLVGRAYLIDGHLVNIGASVGIAVRAADEAEGEADGDQLLRRADLALYRAKAAGRGCLRFFSADMEREAQARRQLEMDMRRAVALRQFVLEYQPQFTLAERRLRGFEALLRWNHPTRGRMEPNDFIPLAEETGLIVGIGDWVIRTACQTAAQWPAPTTVAVNVSPAQLTPGLVDRVATALSRSGLAPNRLEIEITETALFGNPETALAVLGRLKALGVRIAMDDFGTGCSSLGHLRSFPFDRVKIDRSFVMDMVSNPGAAAIVRAVTMLGHTLGFKTTAEGVEEFAHLAALAGIGCTDVQGFALGRPLAVDSLTALLPKNDCSEAST
jgi:diguanylate cyclase (GGDEF)-like protein